MESMDVITQVNEPLVIVEKKDKKLCICLDPKSLNQAIKREEVMAKFNKAKFVTKLNASAGFLQMKLDEESSKLCTFIKPFGRYRFLRLPFGISSAPKMFHKAIHAMFDSVQGVYTSMDDVLVSGSTQEEHDDAPNSGS